MKKLKIGNIELESNVIIAPMAGISNQAFKSIIRNMGAGLITTEMVSDKALINKNEKTLKMIEISKEEHPVALQLFGNEIDSMVEAAKFLDKQTSCDIIDINMGCPAPKITKNHSGSSILKDPQKVYNIAYNIKKNVDKPVTCKMRIGWDENTINAVENAKMMEKAGVDAIFIHGRTTKQMYSGKANWDIIKQVKNSVSIPVIGNGDINSPQKAKEYLDKYNVDGIMIGRAALGNPWVIKNSIDYINNNTLKPEPLLEEKISTVREHLDRLILLKGEKIAINEMRGQASWYFKGLKNANHYKRKIQKINSKNEFEDLFTYITNDQKELANKGIHETTTI